MSQPRGHCCSFLLLSSLDSRGEDCRHPLSQLPPIESRYIPIVSKSWNRHRCPSLLSNCHFLFFIADRFLSNCHIPFNCLHTFLHCNCQFANIRRRFCKPGTTASTRGGTAASTICSQQHPQSVNIDAGGVNGGHAISVGVRSDALGLFCCIPTAGNVMVNRAPMGGPTGPSGL